jgi:hypothetical protein
MTQYFHADGISFDYPDNWTIERETTDDGWTVTLQSPGTAFVLVRLDRNLPLAEDVATVSLEALREDYPDLEARSAVETMASEMAIGHDIEFFSLDLAVSACTRVFYGLAGTVLVFCQVSDADEEEHEPVLRAIRASMRLEE